jgi:hypothetical protein
MKPVHVLDAELASVLFQVPVTGSAAGQSWPEVTVVLVWYLMLRLSGYLSTL